MMRSMMLSEIAQAIPNAQLLGDDVLVNQCALDSRQTKDGDLFVALIGERFDAHDFIADVANNGTKAAVVSKQIDQPISQVLVDDTLEALGYIAKINRQQFKGKVVALTGSAGKTTCKTMLACVLSQLGNTYATQGNFNNEIGVPKTLLALNNDFDYAVLEMGAGKVDDIQYLMQFGLPDVGVLLNALPAHMEGFGSLENVAHTKAQIVRCLDDSGIAVINADTPFSKEWAESVAGKQRILFSQHPETNLDNEEFVYANNIQLEEWGSRFMLCHKGQEHAVRLNIPGQHNISNALAAASVGIAMQMSLKKIAKGLKKFEAVDGRMKSILGVKQTRLIDDTYNANPQAVKMAADVLSGFDTRRILILGDMGELGKDEISLHAQVGEYAKDKIDVLWTVGTLSAHTSDAFGEQAKHFNKQSDLIEYALSALNFGDVVLIKGSRTAAMEKVVHALQDEKKEVS